jgi:L-ascorbate metabolism protein UlaG (beta-lactamase superfamily)
MKKIILILLVVVAGVLIYQSNNNEPQVSSQKEIVSESVSEKRSRYEILPNIFINPVEHASAVLEWSGTTIYSDPVKGKEFYEEYKPADIIFITHEHEDHFDIETLQGILTDTTTLIVPSAVAEKLPENLMGELVVLANNEKFEKNNITIQAVPSYNIREEAQKNHPKGRDNGYIISENDYRVYFSGDSGPTEEMKSLENIDAAFVAMNLPYTMSVENAAEAVLEFVPETVYPYHYRTPDGFSDVKIFKQMVNKMNPDIKVVQLDWYK